VRCVEIRQRLETKAGSLLYVMIATKHVSRVKSEEI